MHRPFKSTNLSKDCAPINPYYVEFLNITNARNSLLWQISFPFVLFFLPQVVVETWRSPQKAADKTQLPTARRQDKSDAVKVKDQLLKEKEEEQMAIRGRRGFVSNIVQVNLMSNCNTGPLSKGIAARIFISPEKLVQDYGRKPNKRR